jgi:hypothetical protein
MSHRRQVTTRVIRPGESPPEERDWLEATPEERIEAVWTLTKACLGWEGQEADEPRLERSVSRVQRSWL